LMVFGLASDHAKRKFQSHIYAWKFRMFKECKLIPTNEQEYLLTVSKTSHHQIRQYPII
jgi:hypothetical protein